MENKLLEDNSLATKFNIDIPLVLSILSVILFSLIILYSASSQSTSTITRQLIRIALSLAVMFSLAQVNYRIYFRLSPIFYTAGLSLLTLVLMLGYTSKGAQRWLDLGFMRFQPAEVMKLAVPMMSAYYLSQKRLPPSFLHLCIAIIITLIPGLLIAKQPDLGTSILVVCSGLFVVFFAGISFKIIFATLALLVTSAPATWYLLHDYQKQRILTLLNPESDPLGKGYHIIQSKIAIGSGGIFGKGWLQGTQSQLEFLPERTTDFIFAVLAEEFGLVGILFLLTLYMIIIMRGMYLSTTIEDTYAKLLCISLTLTFFIYLFVNIGMVTGILPVVGLPLPLFSYGGTSLITIMASFGIILSLTSKKRY